MEPKTAVSCERHRDSALSEPSKRLGRRQGPNTTGVEGVSSP